MREKDMSNQPKTIEQACEMMTKIVGKIASKWARNHRQDYEDLFAEGMLGVCKAWEKYDTTKDNAFNTYAYYWASAYISTAAKKSWEMFNNTSAYDVSDYDLGEEVSPVSTIDVVSVIRELEKLSLEDRSIYEMRLEDKTFQEISDELKIGSLHKARNRYLEIVEMINQ